MLEIAFHVQENTVVSRYRVMLSRRLASLFTGKFEKEFIPIIFARMARKYKKIGNYEAYECLKLDQPRGFQSENIKIRESNEANLGKQSGKMTKCPSFRCCSKFVTDNKWYRLVKIYFTALADPGFFCPDMIPDDIYICSQMSRENLGCFSKACALVMFPLRCISFTYNECFLFSSGLILISLKVIFLIFRNCSLK